MKRILSFILLMFIPVLSIDALTESVIDITKMDIFKLQEAIDNELIDYETITRLYLDRINKYDSEYKSIITINDNAIEEAKKCDEIYKENGRKSILFGMPIIVKDNIDVYSLPTTAGAKSLKDNMPNKNAALIQNLIDKGAIILGKTNMSEFALMASSSVSSYGTVRNAYNKDYSSYGSSGGSAVSVALSFAALGIGTDTNMSVRSPSSANNLYGMRPTLNSVSNDGIINYDITRDIAGPITKTAKENAVVLSIMQSKNENDYINKNASLEGKNIGILKQFVNGSGYGLYKTDNDIEDLFNKTVKILKDNGANIIEIDNFWKGNYTDISNNTACGWTMCYAFNNYIKNTTGSIKSFNKLASSSGHIYSLKGYAEDCTTTISSETFDKYKEKKEPLKKAFDELFEINELDALIYPTISGKLTKLTNSSIESNASNIAPVIGVPSITLPMGEVNGLYYGFDLLGKENSEQTLYDIAITYNKLNNTYKLPSDAPNLYKISKNTTKLVNYYLENKNNTDYKSIGKKSLIKEYKNVINNIKEYFKNYSNISNKSKKANELLKEYKTVNRKIIINKIVYKIKTIISIIFGFTLLILVFIPTRKFKRA